MALRIFVNVVGFTDVERHALNTVFRLSEERDTRYSLWMPDAPEPAKLALVDGQSQQAQNWLERIPEDHKGELFWVGQVAPAHAIQIFERPLHWPDVVLAMDAIFAPPAELDFDLDLGASPQDMAIKRALVVDTDRDARLYYRAKLSSAGIYYMDEAVSGTQALGMARTQRYDLAILDASLPPDDIDLWQLVADIAEIKPAIPMVLVVAANRSLLVRLKGWLAGVQAVLAKPPHPGKLQKLLRKV